jgi:hypothetical protein
MLWLRFLSVVPMALGLRVRRLERRTIARLRDAAADRAERAIQLEATDRMHGWVHQRLQKAGALVRTPKDRYYLDTTAYEAFARRRRIRAFVTAGLALAVAGGLYWTGA